MFVFMFFQKEIAKLAKTKIPTRIGTSHRVFHFLLVILDQIFPEENLICMSPLNFELLRPLGLENFRVWLRYKNICLHLLFLSVFRF